MKEGREDIYRQEVYIHCPVPVQVIQFKLVYRWCIECVWCHCISCLLLMTIHTCKFHRAENNYSYQTVLIHWLYFLFCIFCDNIRLFSMLKKMLFIMILDFPAWMCRFLFLFIQQKDLIPRMTFSHWRSSHLGSCSQEVKSGQIYLRVFDPQVSLPFISPVKP